MPSGAVKVGGLVIDLSANTGQLKTDLAEASASVKTTSQSMVNAWAGVAAESDNATAAGERLVKQLKDEIATFGMSSQELMQHKANLNGVGGEVAALIGRLENLRNAQAGLSAETSALAMAEADATARIRDMVAASLSEVGAMNAAAAATQGLTVAQTGAARVAASWSETQRLQAQNMAGVAAAMKAAQAGTVALSAETQKILAQYDPLGVKLRSLQSDFAILRKEMGNSADPAAIKAFQGLEEEISKTTKLMQQAGADGFGQAEDGAKKTAFATAGATRELMVLGHEIVSGNFSRMPGSFLVLAQRMGGLSTLLTGANLGLVALAVSVAGVASAIVSGHEEMVAMNTALATTNNYAGMTKASMRELANSMTQTKEVSVGVAQSIVTELVRSGKIGGQAIGEIARLASDYAKATGQDIDSIAPKLISVFEDPAHGADELNKSMHALTVTQTEHIAHLVRIGELQTAQLELAKQLSAQIPKQIEQVTALGRAWNQVTTGTANFWVGVAKGLTQGDDATTEKLREIQNLKDKYDFAKAFGLDSLAEKYRTQANALIGVIQNQQAAVAATEAQTAANAKNAKSWDVIKASSSAYHIQELQDRLQQIRSFKPEAGPDVENQEAAKRDAIRKTQDEIDAAYRSMGAEGRQLQQQRLGDEEQLALKRLEGQKQDAENALKLGNIDKLTFDLRATNIALEENQVKQAFEQRMADVGGLTAVERQAHLGKLAILKEEHDQIEKNGVAAYDNDYKKSFEETMKGINDAGAATSKSLDDQIAKQKEHNAEIGKTKEEVEQARQAQAQAAADAMQTEAKAIDALLNQADLQGILIGKDREFYAARLAYLNINIGKEQELANLRATGADKEAGAKAAAELDKYLDPTKAQNFGNALKGSLSGATKSLIELTGAMTKFGKEQAESDKQRAHAQVLLKGNDQERAKGLADLDAINQRSTKEQLASYGNMASAAAGFFDEHSRGYQAMMTASQVFHAAELAMNLASIAPAMAAGAAQLFAQSGWGGFAGVAAMTAVVAGFGVALSSGGASNVAKDRQAAQGAGSVLGDKDAKSESLKKSLDLIEKNTYQGLEISSSMLDTLRSIDSNISHFASQLVRSTDISNPDMRLKSGVSGANIGTVALAAGGFAAGAAVTLIGDILGPVGAVVGALVSRIPAVQHLMTTIFGGKQSVTDSGFGMDPTSLAGILNGGAHAYQYADIKTSGGWFSSDKHSEQTNSLGDSANQQFTAIITSMADGIKAAGEMLGLAGDDFTAKLDSFVVDIGHVSLKDLKGDELQKALEAVFSKLGDDMAQYAVGGLQELQQVGEGYLETLVRVATEYKTIDVVFQSFGKTFGEVGMASIAARDRLVQLAGGLDKFTSQGEYFLKNFFSDKEQAAALQARVDPVLAQYGLSSSGENASKMFRDFIVGLDTTTEEGAKAYTVLMELAPAVKQIADSGKAALDERKSLQDQIDQLTLTAAQLREKERAAVDASNLALFDRVTALNAEKDAVEAAKSAASTLLGGVNDAFSTLQRVTKTTTDSLTARITAEKALSDAVKSTLSSMQSSTVSLMDRSSAQAQIKAAVAIAKAGGPLPTADSLKDALSVVSKDASQQFSTYADYLRDLSSTKADLSELGSLADSSLSVDQQQLDSLNSMLAAQQQQIDLLKGIDVSGLTIAQALAGFKSSVGAAQTNPIVGATQGIASLYQELLGRAPDTAGLQFWQESAAKGVSLDAIRADFMGSQEYKDRQRSLGVPGFATGGDFGGGWRLVGERGPELEATGPARIFNATQTSDLFSRLSSPSSNNDALVAEIKSLKQQLAEATAKNSAENTAVVKQLQAQVDLLTRVIYGGDSIQTKAVTSS